MHDFTLVSGFPELPLPIHCSASDLVMESLFLISVHWLEMGQANNLQVFRIFFFLIKLTSTRVTLWYSEHSWFTCYSRVHRVYYLATPRQPFLAHS